MKLKEWFYFSKSDRIVILFLTLAAAVLLWSIITLSSDNTTPTITQTQRSTSNVQWREPNVQHSTSNGASPTFNVQRSTFNVPQRFAFDPNTADSTSLLRLGLKPWQVRNIYKYRARGGIYRKPEDFAKLYGLTRKEYRELLPFIRISPDYLPAATMHQTADNKQQQRDTLRFPIKITEGQHIMLNTADTNQLKKVPGIGSYFAKKIVNYRQRLGGFYSENQLLEIDNFPKESLKYFSLKGATVKKINLNKLSLNELKKHPYINFYQAQAITDYRRLRGQLTSLNDLRLLKDFPPEKIKQLEPYVEF